MAFFNFGLVRFIDDTTEGWVRPGLLYVAGDKWFVFQTEGVDALNEGYVLKEGEYRISLHVAAADANPVRVVFLLRLVAGWGLDGNKLHVDGEPGLTLLSQHPQSAVGAVHAWLSKFPPAE